MSTRDNIYKIFYCRMGKGNSLNLVEMAQIKLLKEEGYSNRAIAKRIARSADVVNRFIRDPENYGKNQKGGTSKKITERQRRAILREASNSSASARRIAEKVGVSVSVRRVRQVLQKSPMIKRLKMKKKPALSEMHKVRRLDFAKNMMSWTSQWQKVVFTDEKKFNLDGPDGFNYYYHDLRKEERILSRNHSRAGSVMIWGAISYYGQFELVRMTGKQKASDYRAVLEKATPAIHHLFSPLRWILQQDNAPIHTAREVKSWLAQQTIELLPWPACSPDLNIIENVWGWLARKVYEDGKQYDNENDLMGAINGAWATLPLQYLENLYKSLTERIFQVIKNNGGHTKY